MTWVGAALLLLALVLFLWPFVHPVYEDDDKIWMDDFAAVVTWLGALAVGGVGAIALVIGLLA